MDFENCLKIGAGIYTVSDIGRILRLPYHKVNHWVTKYWDGELGGLYQNTYSWTIDNSKAVSFHTLVEFYVLFMLAEAGVKTRQVMNAHVELSKDFNTPFPFAKKKIIDNLRTDGNKIYLDINGRILSLDGSKQFNLDFVRLFFRKLDFDGELIASKLWPMGRDKSIVVDPRRQFGHPVIDKSNIYPETLFNLFQAGEPIDFIAFTYEITQKMVRDAIEFCQAA